jgi:hypothetical protein
MRKLSARYQFDIFVGSVSSKIASGRTCVQARIFHYIFRIFAGAVRVRRIREGLFHIPALTGAK